MNALILAAGFGTRLLPYTQTIPKPLFTLNNVSILDHAIRSLEQSGCKTIAINCHHLADQIREHIISSVYKAEIKVLFEPDILDTGGAIANALPYLGSNPFFVVNADVISSINLKTLYNDHMNSGKTVTMVLHDDERFNTVTVDSNGFVKGFNDESKGLAFTGIQVISPQIAAHFPNRDVFSSIDVYAQLAKEQEVKAQIETDLFWSDIGTIESYGLTSLQMVAAKSFKLNDLSQISNIKFHSIAGDGSDRQWKRAQFNGKTCILCNHGICLPGTQDEKDFLAFIKIGQHLRSKKINLPEIKEMDNLSGVVCLEDLGDMSLQEFVQDKEPSEILRIYKRVIDALILFSFNGQIDFNKEWTCQTPSYSKELIIEKECCYFLNAFVNQYAGRSINPDTLLNEFEFIAEQALRNPQIGLMHRDCQSRNIMIKDNEPYFIDFQSARIGPFEYDLASLLIDPYVNLDLSFREQLLAYAAEQLALSTADEDCFNHCYEYCCLTRNLQMLGAFGFLTVEKQKPWFEQYIPIAIANLKRHIKQLNGQTTPILNELVESL